MAHGQQAETLKSSKALDNRGLHPTLLVVLL